MQHAILSLLTLILSGALVMAETPLGQLTEGSQSKQLTEELRRALKPEYHNSCKQANPPSYCKTRGILE